MGGRIFADFSEMCVSKIEDIVGLLKPQFRKRCVDNTYIQRKKNEPNSLFEKLNIYHPSIQ